MITSFNRRIISTFYVFFSHCFRLIHNRCIDISIMLQRNESNNITIPNAGTWHISTYSIYLDYHNSKVLSILVQLMLQMFKQVWEIYSKRVLTSRHCSKHIHFPQNKDFLFFILKTNKKMLSKYFLEEIWEILKNFKYIFVWQVIFH